MSMSIMITYATTPIFRVKQDCLIGGQKEIEKTLKRPDLKVA